MSTPKFEIGQMMSLLRLAVTDATVRAFFGPAIFHIERDEYYGSLEFKSAGVDVVFNEAPWVISSREILDPKELHLCAFHLHREGHEGFSGYSGQLPNGVSFADHEAEVLRKMGSPVASGGGGQSTVLKRSIPRWHRFSADSADVHFQFDAHGHVEMVTLTVPRPTEVKE